MTGQRQVYDQDERGLGQWDLESESRNGRDDYCELDSRGTLYSPCPIPPEHMYG